MTMLRSIAIVIISLALIGCEGKNDYPYLMTHPTILQKEIADCKSGTQKTPQENAHCRIVIYAAVNFTSLLMEQQRDPQKFGQRTLDAQQAFVQAKSQLIAAQTALKVAKAKNNVPANLSVLNMDLEKAQQNYQVKSAEVNILLAVISLSRPE